MINASPSGRIETLQNGLLMLDSEIKIIDSIEQWDRFVGYVNKLKPEFTVFDTETDSLNTKVAKLFGLGICFNNKYSFYVPWRRPDATPFWSPTNEKAITDFLLELFKRTKLIGHNAIYDLLVLETNWKEDLTPYLYSDTILLKHTLAEEPPFGLKEVAKFYLGDWADKAQQQLYDNIKANGGKTTKEQMDMWKADTVILGEYCAWDVALTWRLFQLFEPKLAEEGLTKLFYEEEVMPLYKNVTINMKRQGFPINVPYFESLKSELEIEINRLEDEIMEEIQFHVGSFAKQLLDKECPVKTGGSFPKVLADVLGAPLPVTKDGKITLAKKGLEAQKAATPEFEHFYDWMLTGNLDLTKINSKTISAAQKAMFFEKHPGQRYAFNLRSNDHLGYLFFTCMGLKPVEFTAGGKPQVDDDFLESVANKSPEVRKIVDFKKLNKLLSTYVDGILERQFEGKIYTDMLQFGTTSGRYASRSPNCQNLPRVKESMKNLVDKYTSAIRKGFIAPEGYKLVDSDYSSLEARCFSSVTEDPALLNVWKNGEDLYSRIAIELFKLKNISANPDDDNYLKKIHPELRQKAKVIALAIPYGSEASRVKELLSCSYNEAKNIIDSYLNAFPGLRKYMASSAYIAKSKGFAKTEFGRVRHLKQVRSWHLLYDDRIADYHWASDKGLLKERRQYKNLINNSRNFPIQGLAAHIINRAMIEIEKEFKKRNLDAYVALMIHDQIVCIAKEDQAAEVKEIMQDKMENTVKLNVSLIAEPQIADNLADSH